MLQQRKQGIIAISSFFQAALCIVLFYLTQEISFTIEQASVVSLNTIWGFFIVSIFCIGMPFLGRSFHNVNLLRLDWSKNYSLIIRQTSLALLMTCIYAIFLKNAEIQRQVIIEYLVSFCFVLLVTNKTIPWIVAKWAFYHHRSDRTIFIGSPDSFSKNQRWIDRNRELGLDLVECISMDLSKENIQRVAFLEDLQNLNIKQLICMQMSLDHNYLRQLVANCNRLGIRLLIINDLHEQIGHTLYMTSYDGLQLIGLRSEPLESPLNRSIKRAFDLLISVPIIVFILPILCLLIAIIQAWQAPGSLLFRQQRAGLGNKEFQILKFRTMRISTIKDTSQAKIDDARVYPCGRWLRKMSLDEVPQFINVFFGEMSLVGPRPHLIEQNKQFETVLSNYNVRAFVKPGITGLAQVRGFRGPLNILEDLEERIKSDVYYVENWSFALDILILVRTAFQILMPSKNAL